MKPCGGERHDDVRHSIVIANRNRDAYLRVCAASLARSASFCGANDWEVLVGTDRAVFPVLPYPVWHICVAPKDGPFNKPRLLNAALAAASGDTITFLDADAIVPALFFRTLDRLIFDRALTKLCYRVRKLDRPTTDALLESERPGDAIDAAFERYEDFVCAPEGYGWPDRFCSKPRGEPVFGNSHFSILRDTLGDLRFDERYCGRGYEDIHFNWLIWMRHYDAYKAEIVTDAHHALLSMANPPNNDADWGAGEYNVKNMRRYRGEFGDWLRRMRQKRPSKKEKP